MYIYVHLFIIMFAQVFHNSVVRKLSYMYPFSYLYILSSCLSLPLSFISLILSVVNADTNDVSMKEKLTWTIPSPHIVRRFSALITVNPGTLSLLYFSPSLSHSLSHSLSPSLSLSPSPSLPPSLPLPLPLFYRVRFIVSIPHNQN